MRYEEPSLRQSEHFHFRPGRWRLAVWLVLASVSTPLTAEDISARYFGAAVQGDLTGAQALLEAQADSRPETTELAERFRKRFVHGTEATSAESEQMVVNEIVGAYQRYWTTALMGRASRRDAEDRLHAELRSSLERQGAAAALMNDEETQATVGRILRAEGFGVQQGRTPPLLDLLVWREEDRRDYAVNLTDGVQPVRVRFLSGFVVRGWLDFATFGHASAGGWATDDGLYCLADRYDRNSETFLVSYLKHEARHFADYQQFPGLPATDMEYRAKLTELIYADETLEALLEQFDASASDDPSASHPFAAFQIMRGLEASLLSSGSLPTDPLAVRWEARRQLDWHTTALVEGGEAVVTRGVFASGVPGLVEEHRR